MFNYQQQIPICQATWPARVAAAEVVLYISTLVLTFLSIVIGNIVILVVIIRRFKARKVMTNSDQGSMKRCEFYEMIEIAV